MPLLLQVSYRLELEGGFGHPHPTHSYLSFTDVTNSLSDLLWGEFDPGHGECELVELVPASLATTCKADPKDRSRRVVTPRQTTKSG